MSGSLSAASSNSALLRLVQQLTYSPNEVELFDALDDIPNFSPERDHSPLPSAVSTFRAGVRDADAVLISTPEYAGGVPGVLKNALDWLVGSGELYGKPAVVVSAAPSAERGRHARASLELTLRMQGAGVCASFTVSVSRAHTVDERAAAARDVLARVLECLAAT